MVLGVALLLCGVLTADRWPVLERAVPTSKVAAISPEWLAVAPGKVEPSSGEIRVGALMLGRVAQVLVSVNDRVGEGDLLVRLDDEETRARLTSAEAGVAARKRDRDATPASGAALDRRRADDAVAAAERAVVVAKGEVDRLSTSGRDNAAKEVELRGARNAVFQAQKTLELERAQLSRLKAANSKATGQLDTALTIARAELAAAQAQFEKTRIRAPLAGTILYRPVRVGETVAPSPERALIVLADISSLRVRADLDERNAAKVSLGQFVHIHSEAFPNRRFSGKVVSIGPALTPAQTISAGRRRSTDGNALDVQVEVVGDHELLPGMQVDVYFLRLNGER
jgi:HlyD family secretion protein